MEYLGEARDFYPFVLYSSHMVDEHSGRAEAERILRLVREKKSAYWSRVREETALRLFRAASLRVPAYKDFLKKHKVNPAKIKTFADFERVPETSKANYLREYPLEKLVWDGTIKKPFVYTATSGSTGTPFYFPLSNKLAWESSVVHELFLRMRKEHWKEPTLVIVAFGMGVWIGGLFTYRAFAQVSDRGANLSILTTGINKQEILHALRRLAPHYARVILCGYAPFLKDVIDEATAEKINLRALNLRLLFAAEAFTEKFRDHICKKARVKNPLLDTMNIYGTADIGTMAFETPFTILARREMLAHPAAFNGFFGNIQKTPTLAQYNPHAIVFEAPRGDVVLTGDNAIPLVCYAIGDHGGAMSFHEAVAKMKKGGVDAMRAARREKIVAHVSELPLVYVYERNDFSTTLYGLQIYPEAVRDALVEHPLNKFLTGKLTMLTKFDTKHDQYLEIHIELQKNKMIRKHIEHHTLKRIVHHLRLKISEFRELHNYLQDRALPKLAFWPYEHKFYFKPGGKQKWVAHE